MNTSYGFSKLIVLFIFLLQGARLYSLNEEEKLVKRVHAHIVINDFSSACEESRIALKNYPHSITLFEAYVKALSKQNDERTLSYIWNAHVSRFPESKEKREILEAIAWSIIENGSNSTSPLIRIMALLSAFFGNDVKGVKIIHKNMSDQNYLVRAISIKLASGMRDDKLKDQVLNALLHDKNWEVRAQALQSAGEMKILEAKPHLLNIIASESANDEEKAIATESLINLLENIERNEVEKLCKSNRAGLRILACQVVEHLDRSDDLDLIFDLVNDFHPEVRRQALKTLGLLRAGSIKSQNCKTIFLQKLNDIDSETAITAAWALTLTAPEEGIKALKPWLDDPDKEIRLTAAAALSATGKYGLALMKQAFDESKDPYVKINIALGLISQRTETEKACQALYDGLSLKDQWMWNDEGLFKKLAPSTMKNDQLIPHYPESVNQQVRLEILNLLAVMKFPKAQNAIRTFLTERPWGISGLAAVVLLTEGDDSAIEIVRRLLSDPDQKIKLQAALVLSLWGEGEGALKILQEAYPHADRETKERILESFGRIGSKSSIPFLTEKLQEAYQSLRIIAAAALLQCLYH